MGSQFFIIYLGKLEADPAAYPDVRRTEEFLGPGVDERRLKSRSRRNPHCDVTVIVMIVYEHRVHSLADKKGRCAMREFFRGLRQN